MVREWNCNVCSRKMKRKDREAHLLGKVHAQKLRSQGGVPVMPAAPLPPPPRDHNFNPPEQTRTLTTPSESSSAGGLRMPAKRRQRHPNGERLIPIKAVQSVHKHTCEIPLAAYEEAGVNLPRRWNSLVTPEDVEHASDAWDAWSVEYDIETQWGLPPGGGVYMDSNFYYGPGECDYY